MKRKPRTTKTRTRRPLVECPHCGGGISEVVNVKGVAGCGCRWRKCAACSRLFETNEQAKLTMFRTIYTRVAEMPPATCINK